MTKPEPVEGILSPTAPLDPAESAAIDLALATPTAPGPGPKVMAAVAVCGGACFLLLGVWVGRHGAAVPGLDRSVHTWVMDHRGPGSLTVAKTVTWGGVTWVVLPTLLAVGALASGGASADLRRRLGAGLLLAGIASVGVYVGLRINALVGRARPSVVDWAGAAGGPSFPSGHTTAATLFAASCAWAIASRVAAGWPRLVVWAGAAVYAGLVGWSRVWLGVHWPTDVLGGWLFGLAWCSGATAAAAVFRVRVRSRASSRTNR